MDKFMLSLTINCLVFSLMAQSHLKNVEDLNTHFYKDKEFATEQVSNHQLIEVKQAAYKKTNTEVALESVESLVEQTYQPDSDTWLNHSKYAYGYDEAGNKSTAFWHVWHPADKQWQGYLKKHPEYDINGNLDKITTYRYQKNIQDWVEDGKLIFKYNRRNQLSESTYYTFHKNSWRKGNKKEYIYNGKVEEVVQYSWDSSKNDWQTHFKTKHVFNSYGNVKTTQMEKWDVKIGRWINFKKHEYAYNGNQELLHSTHAFWSLGNSFDVKGEWVLTEKKVNTYENENRLTQSIFYKWNKTEAAWIDAHKKEYYQHNANGQAGKSALFYWNPTKKVWIKGFKSTYNLSDKPAPDLASNDLKVYPNPTDDLITFDIDKGEKPIRVQLFDMEGKEVLSQILGANRQIKVGHFSEAMYLYKLQRDGVTYTGKFSVK